MGDEVWSRRLNHLVLYRSLNFTPFVTFLRFFGPTLIVGLIEGSNSPTENAMPWELIGRVTHPPIGVLRATQVLQGGPLAVRSGLILFEMAEYTWVTGVISPYFWVFLFLALFVKRHFCVFRRVFFLKQFPSLKTQSDVLSYLVTPTCNPKSIFGDLANS